MRDTEGDPDSVRRDILKKKNMIVITSGKRRVRPALPIPLVLLLLLSIPAGGDTLRVVGRLALPYCTNVTVRNRICYVTDSYGLEAVDVSNPANPVLLGRCSLPDGAQAVTLRDSIAYVSDAEQGLAIVHISNPANMRRLSQWQQYPGYAHEVAVYQETAYLAYGESRDTSHRGALMEINISDPRNPYLSGFFTRGYNYIFYIHWVNYTSIAVENGRVYVASTDLYGDPYGWVVNYGRIEQIDRDPIEFDTGNFVETKRRMHLVYPYAYITYPPFPRTPTRNFTIVNLMYPLRDSVYDYDFGGNGRGIWADTGYVYATFDSTVRYVDVSDPSSPVVLAACTLDNIANGLQAVEPYIYVANGSYLTILQHSPSGTEERSQEVKQPNHQGLRILPNPFRGHGRISFGQAYEGKADLSVYNAIGRKVRSFVLSSRTMKEIPWDGKDEKGNDLPGGVYFLRYKHGTGCETRKIILVR